jgi:hypothetical protein
MWVIWIWILVWVFIDIFRSRDLSGMAKVLWSVFVLFIRLIGVLAYLIALGGSMHERSVQQARQQDEELRSYICTASSRTRRVPRTVSAQASTGLAGGIPFLSDAGLQKALTKAGVTKQVNQAVLAENQQARLDGLRTALALIALLAVIALFFSGRIPAEQPGSTERRHAPARPGSGPSENGI